ncbi:AaceriAAL176Cp [[Ashbya] aceris (nom. inval.)]|nr:AaceriAAL176Cp [[Ashbya] aceris (nom. inval.)]
MLQFKLVLLGDSSVGKSSIVHRFVKDSFDEFRESTIGAAFLSRTIKLVDHDDAMIKFEIWDTAGQERYKSLAPMYYRNANAALVVYDVTQEDSLAKAQSWVNELKSKVGDEDLVICLVGNKLDLVEGDSKPRVIDSEEAQAYAEAHGLIFHEVSAKSGKGILDVFQGIGGKLYEQRRESLAAQPQQSSNIQLQRPTTNDATSCCV